MNELIVVDAGAGGIRALMERIRGHLDASALTVTGRTLRVCGQLMMGA